ncbi:hypothetical protein D3C71_1230800 [compost metagenome]
MKNPNGALEKPRRVYMSVTFRPLMKTAFSATDEPAKDNPPNEELPPTTPGASSATADRSWATGRREISWRLTLKEVSVEYTSTRLTTRVPTTCSASRLTTPPPPARLTVVVPPTATLTATGSPSFWPSRLSCRR